VASVRVEVYAHWRSQKQKLATKCTDSQAHGVDPEGRQRVENMACDTKRSHSKIGISASRCLTRNSGGIFSTGDMVSSGKTSGIVFRVFGRKSQDLAQLPAIDALHQNVELALASVGMVSDQVVIGLERVGGIWSPRACH